MKTMLHFLLTLGAFFIPCSSGNAMDIDVSEEESYMRFNVDPREEVWIIRFSSDNRKLAKFFLYHDGTSLKEGPSERFKGWHPQLWKCKEMYLKALKENAELLQTKQGRINLRDFSIIPESQDVH